MSHVLVQTYKSYYPSIAVQIIKDIFSWKDQCIKFQKCFYVKTTKLKVWKSAVLIPLVISKTGEVQVVLTERNSHLSIFRGEVSLPGGKWERGDESYTDTATRECYEEIGLSSNNLEIISEFFPLITSRKGKVFHVYSTVAFVKETFYAKLNKSEVEDLIILPLKDLLNSKKFVKNGFLYVKQTGLVNRYCEYVVFGLTYQFLAMLGFILYSSDELDIFMQFLDSVSYSSYPASILRELYDHIFGSHRNNEESMQSLVKGIRDFHLVLMKPSKL